ncbi:hypothetical protein ABIB62_001818 [Mucilaginibacter sp. UYP25]
MEDKITYPFSKWTCFFYSCFLLTLIAVWGACNSDLLKGYTIYGMFEFGFLLLLPVAFFIRILKRYVIPAIKGKPALEINQQGVIDYARNFMIEWADISDFRMGENKGDATLYFYFKLSSGIEDFKIMRLRWVNGDYLEIYGIIEANLEEHVSRH